MKSILTVALNGCRLGHTSNVGHTGAEKQRAFDCGPQKRTRDQEVVGLISSVCVVRRIGGRNSHPDFHWAPCSCKDRNLERSKKQGDKTLVTIITHALQLQGGWLTHYGSLM